MNKIMYLPIIVTFLVTCWSASATCDLQLIEDESIDTGGDSTSYKAHSLYDAGSGFHFSAAEFNSDDGILWSTAVNSSTGDVGEAYADREVVYATVVYYLQPIQVDENTVAILFRDTTWYGIRTYNYDASGTFTEVDIDTSGKYPETPPKQVATDNNNTVVVCVVDSAEDLWCDSWDITDAGTVTRKDQEERKDAATIYNPATFYLGNNNYLVIASAGQFMQTFTVDPVTKTFSASIDEETPSNNCVATLNANEAQQLSDNIFMVACEYNNELLLYTYYVATNGTITPTEIDSYNTGINVNSHLSINSKNNGFLIFYSDDTDDDLYGLMGKFSESGEIDNLTIYTEEIIDSVTANYIGDSDWISDEIASVTYLPVGGTFNLATIGVQMNFYFVINATDMLNASTIMNFNATINGTEYNTTTGELEIDIEEGVYNITIEADGYVTRTYTNWDTGSGLSAELYPGTGETVTMTLNILDAEDEFMDNPYWEIQYTNGTAIHTGYSNPDNSINLVDMLGTVYDTGNYTITVEDLDELYQDFEETYELSILNSTINITMTPNSITLNFLNESGSPVNVSGYDTDGTHVNYFCDESIVSPLQNYTNEAIVRMNFDSEHECNLTSYTQFYEFINDHNTHDVKNITIIDSPTQQIWFKVMDMSNRPIENALIRMSFRNPYNATHAVYMFGGQRLTQTNGKTYFYINPNYDILIEVIKDNYVYERNSTFSAIQLNTTSESYPQNLYLQRSFNNIENGIYVLLPREFSDRTQDIYGSLLATGRTSAKFTTDYRISMGYTNKTISLNNHDQGYFTITSGSDFSPTGTADIVVHVYADNVLVMNHTIKYKPKVSIITRPVAEDLTPANTHAISFMAWIAILLVSSLAGMLIGSPGEEQGVKSGKMGTQVFLVSCILLPLIIATGYWLIATSAIYYVLIGFRKLFGE